MRTWWRMNWDYLLVVSCVLVLALLVGGALSATLDAVRQIVAGY
jgi:hypothetical protein